MKPKLPSKQCPSCGQEISQLIDAQLIPFCSKRCKYIDLGKWFKEEYSIALVHNDMSEGEDMTLPQLDESEETN